VAKKHAEKSIGQELADGFQEVADFIRGKPLPPREKLDGNSHNMSIESRKYTPQLVKKTRDMLGVSQSLLAKFLGVSTATVAGWEQGNKKPGDLACRFLDEIRQNPAYWIARIQQTVSEKKKTKTA